MRLAGAAIVALFGVFVSPSAHACTYLSATVIGEDGEQTGEIRQPPPLPAPAARVKAALPKGIQGEAIVALPDGSHAVSSRDPCLENRWPWASITKQVVAMIVMQEVERGTLSLDAPLSQYLDLPRQPGSTPPTLRQLLQHRSGLRNPEDTPVDAAGIPEFYTTGPSGPEWCLSEREPAPADGWRYNNCDYIVMGRVLEAATDMPIADLIRQRLAEVDIHRTTLAMRKPRNGVGLARDFPLDISRYGASGALLGPLSEMVAFDRALLDGKLISQESLETMWAGDPQLGYMALGQWAYEVPLEGCAKPVRIVERRGDILAYELRNFILPESGTALAVAVKDDEIEFGELWQGRGLSFDLLSALACGDNA